MSSNTKNGKISLRDSRENIGDTDWLNFIVKDTGAGINPKILENLFKGYTDCKKTPCNEGS